MSKLTYGDKTIETSVDLGSDLVLPNIIAENCKIIVRYKEKFPHIYKDGMYKIGNGLLPYYEVERLFSLAKDVQTFSIKTTKTGKVLTPYKQVKGHLANEIIERLEIFLEEMQDEDEVYTLSADMSEFAKATPTNLPIRQMYTEPYEVFALSAGMEEKKFNSFPTEVLETAVEIYVESDELGEEAVRLAIADAIDEVYPDAKLNVDVMDEFVIKTMSYYNNPGMFESSLLMFKAKAEQEEAFKEELVVPEEIANPTQLTDVEVETILEESREMADEEVEEILVQAPERPEHVNFDYIEMNPDVREMDPRLIKMLHSMFGATAKTEGLDVLLMHPRLMPASLDYDTFMQVPVSKRLIHLDGELYSDLVSEFSLVAEMVADSISIVKLYGIAHAIFEEGADISDTLIEALAYAT